MRTFAIVLGLSLLVASTLGATSSSVTSSSSSVKSNVTYSAYSLCSKGDDAPCTGYSADYCCIYSWIQYTGSSKVETYMCGYNPGKYSLLSSLVSSAKSVASAVTGSSGFESGGGYCANSVFVKVSAALVTLGCATLMF